MTGNERRSAVLDTVRGAVCRDRQNSYGDAEDNFQNIADYWNLWLRQRGFVVTLNSLDVAMMSLLLKTARASANLHYSDNWVDAAGYAVCGAGIVARENETAARENETAARENETATPQYIAYFSDSVTPTPTSYAAALNEACATPPTT